MKQATVSHNSPLQGQQPPLCPVELTDDEVFRLMRAFTQGKTEILDEDALTLVQWARGICMGAFLLERVLEGALIPIVKEGVVTIAIPDSGEQACSAGPGNSSKI